jgi:hypothetical protein
MQSLEKGPLLSFLQKNTQVPFSLADNPEDDAEYQHRLADALPDSHFRCVGWRQHGDCRPDGPREVSSSCSE